MKLFVLVTLTMIAFAANSVLNRLGVADGLSDPISFALIRLASGAAALVVFASFSATSQVSLWGRSRALGVLGLTLYMIGFSLAYLTLDAGTGALILFGGVQVTIFLVVMARGEALPAARWQGAGLAMIGLAYLLLPGADAPDLMGALLMGIAAIGWGIYTLVGRGESDALGATAGNFLWAAGLVGLFYLSLPMAKQVTSMGAVYAVISGVVTSAAGYALWYRVLPRLEASIAGIAQLTVPVIALAGGMIFLGEAVTLSFVVASLLVLGGVAWSLR